MSLCFFVPLNLYFKSMLDFNVLKLNNTELSNFATELFFFMRDRGSEGQMFKVFFLILRISRGQNLYHFEPLHLPLQILQLILVFILTDCPEETNKEESICSWHNGLSVINSVCIRCFCIIVPENILASQDI